MGRQGSFHARKASTFLAAKGVFIRGAICRGKIYIKPKRGLIFGPGLVQSYDLERALAIFPRIVVEARLVKNLSGQAGVLPPNDFITQRDDGVVFVDYLFGPFIISHVNGETEEGLNLLRKHKGAVQRALSSGNAQSDERVRQKYLWVGHYHNWTLDRLHNRLKHSSPTVANQLFPHRISDVVLRY